MDRFDLHWPKMDASFLTDGFRCRIVWRSAGGRGGPGGSIDNNVLCKKRLAEGLPLAPGLLDELRSRGYGELAAEIDELAGGQADAEQPTDDLSGWLDGLPGSAQWEAVSARRGKVWIPLGMLGDEVLELRPPPVRGKQEWVLRRSWPEERRKAECIAAGNLKGIFAYLLGREGAGSAEVKAWLSACAELDHPEVSAAREDRD